MPIDLELSEIPKQTVIGLCVDCDISRAITKNGKCSTCGSGSVVHRGAVEEMEKQIRLRAIEEEKSRCLRDHRPTVMTTHGG